MAQGGGSDEEMDKISKKLADVHLNVMDQEDNYVYVYKLMYRLNHECVYVMIQRGKSLNCTELYVKCLCYLSVIFKQASLCSCSYQSTANLTTTTPAWTRKTATTNATNKVCDQESSAITLLTM